MINSGFYYVVDVSEGEIVSGPVSRPARFGVNSEAPLGPVENGWFYYEAWVDTPTKPGRFYTLVVGTPAIVGERVERVDTWEEWDPADILATHEADIEAQRISADQRKIDVERDPGLVAPMASANAKAESERDRLYGTAEEDLKDFVPDVASAPVPVMLFATTAEPQVRTIAEDPATPVADKPSITTLADELAAYIAAGDEGEPLPAIIPSVRNRVGIPDEGSARLSVRWEFIDPWWHMSLELRISRPREEGETYFLPIYNDTADPDPGDTTTGYLHMPALTDMGEGRYVADRQAVNLQSADLTTTYYVGFAVGHISNQEANKLLVNGDGESYREYPVRWGEMPAIAVPASAGAWFDTGREVSYVGANLVRVGDTSDFETGDRIKFNGHTQEYIVQSVHSTLDLILDAQPPAVVVGDRVLLWT